MPKKTNLKADSVKPSAHDPVSPAKKRSTSHLTKAAAANKPADKTPKEAYDSGFMDHFKDDSAPVRLVAFFLGRLNLYLWPLVGLASAVALLIMLNMKLPGILH